MVGIDCLVSIATALSFANIKNVAKYAISAMVHLFANTVKSNIIARNVAAHKYANMDVTGANVLIVGVEVFANITKYGFDAFNVAGHKYVLMEKTNNPVWFVMVHDKTTMICIIHPAFFFRRQHISSYSPNQNCKR